ncbi:hypothetical protein MACH26_35720 [Planctobacterium marinum]|uniref:Amidohydrolase-related domain-containing protein n=2 Tax=Planctobacterium marinum TaxID=1631968 RepID=A0AA48HNI5_9ALTE|nr:hypothetical protein MACH26_35720 [Planctobacterium marinum]
MKFIAALLFLLLLSGCAKTVVEIPDARDFVLVNVNVVDVKHQRILPNQNIVVTGGVIADIYATENKPLPENIEIIEGAGGFVTPGLIDMHVHIYEPAAYTIALSHGVTHVRILNGIEKQLQWRDAVNNDALIGASSTVSSPIISGYEDAMLHHTVHTEQQARAAVRKYKRLGYDLIKAYGNLSEEALLGLVDEAQKLNFPVAKHGPHASGDLEVEVLAGLQSFEHVEDIYQGPLNHKFDENDLPAIIADLKQVAVPLTPTLSIFQQLTLLSEDKQSFLDKVPQHYTSTIIAMETKSNQTERWLNASPEMALHNRKTLNFLIAISKQLHEQDIPLLVGSDSGVLLLPHGLATHEEMKLLQQAGLNNYQVLEAATVNPAKALGLEKQIGQIRAGFMADFLYTRENPVNELSVLVTPDALSKKGRWLNSEKLTALRDEAIDNRSVWSEFWALWRAL